jgi:microcystin-dependent protein
MSRVQIPVVAQDAAGNAVSGASVTIVNRQTGQAPVVYTTETGAAARSLPLTTGVNGRPPESWVDRAAYLITVTAPAIGTDTLAWDAAAARDEAVDAVWLAQSQRWMPGDVKQTTRSAAPPGWIKAIGATLARADYAALWAVAQAEIAAGNAIYGAGDGSTTFTVADLSRRVLIGAGSAGGLSTRALGAGGGAETHLLSAGESGVKTHGHAVSQTQHSHSINDPGHGHNMRLFDADGVNANPRGGSGNAYTGSADGVVANTTGVSVNAANANVTVNDKMGEAATSGHNNMPPFVTVHTLIKT